MLSNVKNVLNTLCIRYMPLKKIFILKKIKQNKKANLLTSKYIRIFNA